MSWLKQSPRALAMALEEQTSFGGEVKRRCPGPSPRPAKVRRTREELVKFLLAQQPPPLPERRPEALGVGPVLEARRDSWGSPHPARVEPLPPHAPP